MAPLRRWVTCVKFWVGDLTLTANLRHEMVSSGLECLKPILVPKRVCRPKSFTLGTGSRMSAPTEPHRVIWRLRAFGWVRSLFYKLQKVGIRIPSSRHLSESARCYGTHLLAIQKDLLPYPEIRQMIC
jgi:hypothetical protein